MKAKSIQEIGVILKSIENPKDPFLDECRADGRKGVQSLLQRWEKAREKRMQLEMKWTEMNNYEMAARKDGHTFIAGVDEVGRGPLAGPVVAAAVILPQDYKLLGLDDSKKISEARREELYVQIMNNAIAVGIGIIDQKIIDKINIYESSKKAMVTAIEELASTPDYLLVDAMKLPVEISQESIIKGDAKSVSIAAASIVAKVTRDRLMCKYDQEYPQYGFKKNMGYGTAEHLKALKEFGPTPYHRMSFSPVKECVYS